MKALIFGINGQDGYYLTKLLKVSGIEVLGISRKGDFVNGSVADYVFVEEQIKTFQPDYIFHLAAASTTRHSALFENHETISTGSINILEAARLHVPLAKVFLSGSAMQFENDGNPIEETTAFEASSPYSVARIQSVYAARYYRAKFGSLVYVGYFFNHDSPLRNEHHVNQKIVRAVQRIDNGSEEKLELGNISVRKEFGFAGDIVEAIWKLVNQNTIFEMVIGTGEAHSIEEWVAACFATIGKKWEDHVVVSENFVAEYDVLVSNPALLKSLGWKPATGFLDLVSLMMNNKE